MSFWHKLDDEYGWIHSADTNAANYRPEPLLIFVHGIFGDPIETWKSPGGDIIPEQVLLAGGVDLDVFTYRYPAGLQDNADVEEAAEGLAAVLRAQFSRFRHYIFVVHSTGGLVVKAMLRKERAALCTQLRERSRDYWTLDFHTLRARRIINLDVPHAGGEFWKSKIGGAAYNYLVRWLLVPWTLMRGRFPGHNKIVGQLESNGDWVSQLELDHIDFMGILDHEQMPRPVSLDVLSSDKTIERYKGVKIETVNGQPVAIRSDAEQLQVRGTHSSHKGREMLRSWLADRLAKWCPNPNVLPPGTTWAGVEVRIARQTIELSYDFNRSADVNHLIGADAKGKAEKTPRPKTQAATVADIAAAIRKAADKPRCLVVTGDAGVGKSVAVRMLARTYLITYLAHDRTDSHLPIILPLQRVKLSPEDVKAFQDKTPGCAFTVLEKDICPYVNGFLDLDAERARTPGNIQSRLPRVDSQWLHHHLQAAPTLLILDGVDEFFTNNPGIGLDRFTRMLREIEQKYADASGLVVLLGVRNEQEGIDRFPTDPRHVFRIPPLTVDDAEDLWPGAKAWLEGIDEPDLLELLLKPLILTQLGPRFRELDPAKLNTRSAIHEAALNAIIHKSNLRDQLDATGQPIGAEGWKNALMAVAAAFHSDSRAEMRVDEIASEVRATITRWLSRDDDHGERLPECDSLIDDMRLASEQHTMEMLLRTIFFPTAEKTYRFLHRQWEDFLCSRYLAQAVRLWRADELSRYAFTQTMFRSAGEQLSNMTVEGAMMAHFMDRSARPGKGYIIGNFCAVVCNSLMPIEGPALALLFKRYDEIIGTARHVVLVTFGRRALNSPPEQKAQDIIAREFFPSDPTASNIRQHLLPLCLQILEKNTPAVLPVTAHVAWCYLFDFARRFSTAPPSMPPPDLSFGKMQSDTKMVELVATPRNGTFTITPADRTIQRAFLRIQRMSLREPRLLIATIHYLYFLSLAKHYHAQIAEVDQELPELLHHNPQLFKCIESYKLPALMTLFRTCQQICPP